MLGVAHCGILRVGVSLRRTHVTDTGRGYGSSQARPASLFLGGTQIVRSTLKKSGRMTGHPTLRGNSRTKVERSILWKVTDD